MKGYNTMRRLFLIAATLVLLAPSVSAVTVSASTLLEQNGYIPSNIFMFMFALAIVTLVASYRYSDDMCGIIAIMASFITMWTSRTIDYVTGVAIDSTSQVTVIHTLYHNELVTISALIVFILSLLNGYRIYLKINSDSGRGDE